MILKRFSKKTLLVLLLCFVVLVGAVGAYAYLLNNQKSVGLKAVINGYALEIDKAVYKRGEPVRITFRNNGDETVLTSHNWYDITNSEGRMVWQRSAIRVVMLVRPGESLTDVWGQLDIRSEEPVPPGNYTVRFYPLATPPELAKLILTFEIV